MATNEREGKMAIGKMHTRGMWGIAYKATDVLCVDGKRRTVRITAHPDTYFSIPGSVSVKGKTVSGFVTGFENSDGVGDLEFIAYEYRKNGALLPGMPTHDAVGSDNIDAMLLGGLL
jgi:hypothetical protein